MAQAPKAPQPPQAPRAPQASQTNVIELIKRGGVSALYVVGTVLAVFNITAFKGAKHGLYFKDVNQHWLAVGLSLLVAGWLVRNWKKL